MRQVNDINALCHNRLGIIEVFLDWVRNEKD